MDSESLDNFVSEGFPSHSLSFFSLFFGCDRFLLQLFDHAVVRQRGRQVAVRVLGCRAAA